MSLTRYVSEVPTREARNFSRGLEHLNMTNRFSMAKIDAVAVKRTAIVDAVVSVAKRGMEGVGLLSQLEQQMSAMIPGSTNRLAFIADRAVLAVGDVVSDTVREMRYL